MRKLFCAALLGAAATSVAGCSRTADTAAVGANDTVLLNEEGGSAPSEANAASDDPGANLFDDAPSDPQAPLDNTASTNRS